MSKKTINSLIIVTILLVVLVFSFPYLSQLWTGKVKPNETNPSQSNQDQPETQPEKPSDSTANPDSTATTNETTNPENNPTPPTQPDTTPKSPTPPQENQDINQNRGKYEEMKDAYSRDII